MYRTLFNENNSNISFLAIFKIQKKDQHQCYMRFKWEKVPLKCVRESQKSPLKMLPNQKSYLQKLIIFRLFLAAMPQWPSCPIIDVSFHIPEHFVSITIQWFAAFPVIWSPRKYFINYTICLSKKVRVNCQIFFTLFSNIVLRPFSNQILLHTKLR